jgi:AcrR family transcriptional regulator
MYVKIGRTTDSESRDRGDAVSGTVVDTRLRIIEATRRRLLADGFVGLSTRKVADEAEVPLSQLHYHFGSKGGLVLALFEEENKRRLDRQTRMYAEDIPLWRRYEQACDYLEYDLDSGYVRVLQEMVAAGWSDREVAAQVVALLEGWFDLLVSVTREAERRLGPLGPFTAEEVAGLVGLSFLGGETVALLGNEEWSIRVRSWLRSVVRLLQQHEQV